MLKEKEELRLKREKKRRKVEEKERVKKLKAQK